jgi:hypothetical protein
MNYRILKEYNQVLMMTEDVLGSGTTNNEQLTKLGVYLFGENYLGTYSSDKIPKQIKNNQCFILNTDSSKSLNRNGHWVAFGKLNGKLYYYDSFGRPLNKLSKYWVNKRILCTNTIDRDQSFTESSCGSRCISFLVIFMKYGCIDVV